jgi:hypothetical protein
VVDVFPALRKRKAQNQAMVNSRFNVDQLLKVLVGGSLKRWNEKYNASVHALRFGHSVPG